MSKRLPQPFMKRLLEAVHNVPGLDKLGQADEYDYVKACQVFEAFRAELRKAEILILPNEISVTTERITSASGTMLNEVTLKKEFIVRDCRTPERETFAAFGQAQCAGDKALNKAKTAAFKYFFRDIGIIPWLDVDDSENDRTIDYVTAPVEKKKRGSTSAKQLSERNVVAFARACQDGGKTIIQQAAYIHALGKKSVEELTPEEFNIGMRWAYKNGDLAEVMEMSRNIAERKKVPVPETAAGD